SLEGWRRCKTLAIKGNGRPDCQGNRTVLSSETGTFYFAATPPGGSAATIIALSGPKPGMA
ncbi:MAG: hypothetical protein ABSH05_26035, partial [Bryobacteraceae bacterium]